MKNIRMIMLTVLSLMATAIMAQDYSNNFEVRRLDESHFRLMGNDETIVNMGTRGMTIMAKGESVKDGNAVCFDATDSEWEAEAHMVLYPTSEGGLVLMQDQDNYWGVTATYKKIYVRAGEKTVKEIKNPYGRYMHMRLQYAKGKLTIAVAPQKTAWKIEANSNPKGVRKPATNWKVLATLNVAEDARQILLTADQKDVVSVRDFWYRAK